MSIPQNNQLNEQLHLPNEYLYLPNPLQHFSQTSAEDSGNNIIYLDGEILSPDLDKTLCPKCQSIVHINNHTTITLRHLCLGNKQLRIRLNRRQFFCPYCHHTFLEQVPFKAPKHFITKPLKAYVEQLLATGLFTISAIARLTRVHREIIKSIDKHRLRQRYETVLDENGNLKCCYHKVKHPVRLLGIDEFSLHHHYRYATIIVDLDTGEVLYVAYGRKKQVVYDFMAIFGDEFMEGIEAVASDMNSDYTEAFRECYPHLEVIFDHFHIVKNFNDNVIAKIRRDEYAKLWKAGKWKEASLLKGSKYLLFSNYDVLGESEQTRVDNILRNNKLLFIAEIVKEELQYAYRLDNVQEMADTIEYIIGLCRSVQNKHFDWFSRLLEEHLEGIIAHAIYSISTGKVEGINNKIKTMRRQAYGFRDDEYFFLKILDITNKSHKKME